MLRFRIGPLWRFYYPKRFTESIKVLNSFVEQFVEQALASTAEKKFSFTSALSEFTRDRKLLRDQLVNTLIAGRDSTAATLSWLFYEFSYHPEVYARVRNEVLDKIGHERPTYDDLKSMKYLQRCLSESTNPSSVLISPPPVSDRTIQSANGVQRYDSS